MFSDVEFIKPLFNALVAQPAAWMMTYVDSNGLPRPSWDLWEERRGVHTFTVAATIGALQAAALFARDFGDWERADAIQSASERMRDAMLKHLWNPEMNCFARMASPIEDAPANSAGTAATKPGAAPFPPRHTPPSTPPRPRGRARHRRFRTTAWT